MHNGIAEPPPERQILKARDPGRKKRILDTKRANPSLKASDIARIAACEPRYVRQVLNDLLVKPVKANLREPAPPGPSGTEADHGAQAEPGAASNPKWFQRAVANSAALIAGLDPLLERLRRGETSPTLSTDLHRKSRIRNITAKELKANTFLYDLNSTDKKEQGRSRSWLRDHFSSKKRSSQGFAIMDAHKETDGSLSDALFEQLTPLLDDTDLVYRKELKTIFQTLQSKKKPKGDGKRLQAKMTALVAASKVRLKEVQDLIAHREKFPVPSAGSKEKRTLPMLQQELKTIQKEVAVIHESTMAMTRAYDRIQKVPALPCCRAGSLLITCVPLWQVWPGPLHMPETVSDTDRLATLASVSGVGDQSIHCDSPEPGNSGITAYDEDQDIYILWNSFLAMIVLGELQADREEATALLRSSWASRNPSPSGCTDAEWKRLEPSAWELLVHHEFKARGVKDFEVVRVPIQKTKTVVIDSRTSHAGSRRSASSRRERLYRGHFYGFRQDVLHRPAYLLSVRDETVTVDLCDADYFPIVTWAQRGAAGPIFAQK